MKKSSFLFSIILLFGGLASAKDSAMITCEHKDLHLKVIVKNIQPFSVGNEGNLTDLTTADLVLIHDGQVERTGAIGPRNENLESFQTDEGTGIEFKTDSLGRVTAQMYSQKFKLRTSTSSGLECVDHRDAWTQKWMKNPSTLTVPSSNNGAK